MKYYLKNIKQTFGNGIIFFPIFLCLLLSTVVVSANEANYGQKDCKSITFQDRFVENCQLTINEKSSLEFENSRCLRHELFKTKEKNISVASKQQNIFPSQNCIKVELAKDVTEFEFGSAISENDFSNQKSYIRLGGVKCVGKVARVAAEEGVGYSSFRAFKAANGSAGEGMAWHHIVEQTPANVERFGAEAIHNTGNLMRLEHGAGTIHAQVSGYYSSIQPFTNGLRVRQWLSPMSFQEQYEFGIQTLKLFGQ